VIDLTSFILRNTRLCVAATLLVVLTGIFLFLDFPAQEDPQVKVRVAVVSAAFPGMSPQRIENLIAKPLEQKIREIPQVETITSTSVTGSTSIQVKLYDKYFNLAQYWQDLRNKMADMRSALPSGTLGPVVNDSFGEVAVATVAITADGFTMAEMRDIVTRFRDKLATVQGVKNIDVQGLLPERVYLEGSTANLSQLGLSVGSILDALTKENVIQPGGQLAADGTTITIEPTGNFNNLADIADTPISVPKTGQSIRLGDILKVRRAYLDPPSTAAFFDNHRAVVLAVSMVEGDNIIDFGARLKAGVARLEPTLPIGFEVNFATFQPDVVYHSIKDVERTLYETLVIVLCVVMIFLGLRTGLIVGSIVPLTMLMALIVMRFMDIELQRVSIASMIIALGLLVDNGIVIAEDIMRRLAGGEDRRAACINAGRTLSTPLLTSSLTIILAFMPLLLADDQTGEYVRSLAQVIAITLLSSWVLSLTVTPTLCFYFLKASAHHAEDDHQYETRFYRGYRGLLTRVIRHRILFLMAIGGLFVGALYGFGRVPQQFFPNSDRNEYMIILNLASGTQIGQTEAALSRIDQWLLDKKVNPETESVMSYLGYGGPRIVLAMAPVSPGPQRAYFLVNVPLGTKLDPIIERVREHLLHDFPNVSAEVKAFWLGGTEPGLVQFRIAGDDANTLKGLAERVKQMLLAEPGTVNVKDDWENRVIKLVVNIDQARASRAGVTSSDIALSLNTVLQGTQVSTFREGDQAIPIVMRGDQDEKLTLDRLRTIYVFSSDGKVSVPLNQVADFVGIPQDGAIQRRNGERTVTVSAKSLELSASALNKAMRPQLATLKLPAGYRIGVGGELEVSGNAQNALLKFMPVCFGAIMLLMIWQFNSFRKVAIIAITIPLCLIGAVAGLLVSHATFGFMAIMGLLSLAGIIVNNAILLLDRIWEEIQDGKQPYDAVIYAALKRLRPIVMTKLTCILGLVPLMIFGGDLWYGMTVVIMGGLALGTLLTLGVIPVLYTVFFRVKVPRPAPSVKQPAAPALRWR
jgi:multidrug efflux pump subunit AcrB